MSDNSGIEYDMQRKARAGSRAALRALVSGYLLYLAWEIVKGVRTGSSAMAPAVGYAFAAFFVLAAAAFGFYLLRQWRREVEAARLPSGEEADNPAGGDDP